MSEDIHVRGAILIGPPITWAETAELDDGWLSTDPFDRDALLRVVQDEQRTDTGVVQRRTVDAIIPASLVGWNLLEHVQDIVTTFGETHNFSGHLDCSYAHGEDVWRIYVHEGRAVEVRPPWPEDHTRWEPFTTTAGYEAWRTPTGDLKFEAPEDTRADVAAGWRRLHYQAGA